MVLNAENREKLGKSSKSIRKEGLIPAVIFGKGMESVPISLKLLEFTKLYTQTGDTDLIDVKIAGGKTYKCLVKEVQYDPISLNVTHVGLYKPDLTEKINAEIPVEIVGEEENSLVKSGEGLVLVLIDTIEVSALPADLPHEFKVDISNINEIGDGITIGDLDYDKEKVEIVDLEEDVMVAKIDYAEMEEVEEEIDESEAVAGIEATEETAEDKEKADEEE